MTVGAGGDTPQVFVRTLPAMLSEGASAERFMRELGPARQLASTHILPVFTYGTTKDGEFFYTMPFLAGEWLPLRLRQGPMPVEDVLSILRDVADALAVAHAQGVVHGSLAPDKVILTNAGAVVTDFGVAIALVRARGKPLVFARVPQQPTIGDPSYLAPEQLHGTTITPQADIYGWGALAYEMLGGSPPAQTPVHLLLKAPQLPVSVSSLVMACLEKDPAARPASAADLQRTLDDDSLLDEPGSDELAGPLKTTWGRRSLGALICIAAAFFAFGGPALIARYRGITPGAPVDSLAPTGAITSVAVLPFTSAGGLGGDYLSDALARELAHALSRLPRMGVPGEASVATFKANTNPAQAAKSLGVAAVVTGSIEQAGQALRASVQVVSAQGKVLWNGSFERPAAQLFQLQDDYTRGVLSAIVPGLKGPAVDLFAVRSRGTEKAAAYDLFLQATHALSSGGYASAQHAVVMLARALGLDPTFTRAAASQSAAYLALTGDTTVNRDSTLQLAIASARRALSLDLASSDAHIALGDALEASWRFTEAGAQYQTALEQVPGDARTTLSLARNLLASGKVDRALAEAQMASAHDPLSTQAANLVALALLDARRFPEAIRQSRAVLAIDPTSVDATRSLARAYIHSAQADSAIRVLEPVYAKDSTAMIVRATLMLAYEAAARKEDVARMRSGLVTTSAHPSDYADLVVALVDGNSSAALSALAQGAAHGGDIATYSESIGCDPLFDRLKSAPQFLSLLGALGVSACSVPPGGSTPPKP